MRQLRYTDQAKSDLIQIKRYISGESGSNEVALKYTDKLRQQCRKIAELPGTMGRERPELMEDIRSLSYGNYVILFRYSGSIVEIVSIIEGHRDIEGIFH
jgi:toxin ParE1/3/4